MISSRMHDADVYLPYIFLSHSNSSKLLYNVLLKWLTVLLHLTWMKCILEPTPECDCVSCGKGTISVTFVMYGNGWWLVNHDYREMSNDYQIQCIRDIKHAPSVVRLVYEKTASQNFQDKGLMNAINGQTIMGSMLFDFTRFRLANIYFFRAMLILCCRNNTFTITV